MEIIILGTSPITKMLIEQLLHANHTISVVSKDLRALKQLENRLEVRAIHAHPAYPDSLRKANAAEADIIIAITDSDEVNMIACQIAHSIFKISTKIARISNSHYVVRKELFGDQDLPIDVFINPEKIIARSIRQLLMMPGAKKAYDLCNGQLKALEPMKTVRTKISPHAQTIQCKAKKKSIVLIPSLHIEDCQYHLIDHPQDCRKVIIAGANQNSGQLARLLNDTMNITIIDPSHEKCLAFAENYPDLTCVCDEFSNKQLLLEENIGDTDWFLALTDDDEDNLISAMLAKKLGCKKTLALIANLNYLDIIEPHQVDALLSPKALVMQSIYSRLTDHRNTRSFHFPELGHLICIRLLSQNQLPDLPLQYVFRDHQIHKYRSSFQLQKGDFLLFFTELEPHGISWNTKLNLTEAH